MNKNGPPTPATKPRFGSEFSLTTVTTKLRQLPNRIVLHAKGGWGKTSFAAQIPDAIFVMAGDEDGLLTLLNSGELPETISHWPQPTQTVNDFRLALNELVVQDHPYKAMVGDSLTAVGQLIDKKVCEEKFRGDWEAFYQFDKGPRAAAAEWETILPLFDRLREKGIGVFLIAHSKVINFKNPEGPDYERWTASLSKYAWERIYSWADMVLFGSFETLIDKAQRHKSDAETKGKAKGGQTRVLYTEHHAAYDAKNRHGLPEEIECGSCAQEAWANFIQALKKK